MYAIIESGGKQHRVALGEKIRVERLDADVGSEVPLENVLLVAGQDEPMIGTPHLDDFKILAKVVEHGRGKKIRVIKMKRRKNYRRTQGHRQDYTELEITKLGDAKPVAKKAPATKKAEPAKAEPKETAKETPKAKPKTTKTAKTTKDSTASKTTKTAKKPAAKTKVTPKTTKSTKATTAKKSTTTKTTKAKTAGTAKKAKPKATKSSAASKTTKKPAAKKPRTTKAAPKKSDS